MPDEPHADPASPAPRAPTPPQKGQDIAPKLGRDQPGRGLDTGVDTGAIEPGGSSDRAGLNP